MEPFFTGNFRTRGEVQESAYLARALVDYDDIEEGLPQWAERIYGDLARHVQVGQADVPATGPGA